MKISNTMIRSYLGQITLTYFVENDEMPEDFGEFDGHIATLRYEAEAAGDLPWLELGLQYLLNDPQTDLAAYSGGMFPLHDSDMREIISYLLDRLEAPGGTEEPAIPITLEEMTGDEWRAYRAGLTPP